MSATVTSSHRHTTVSRSQGGQPGRRHGIDVVDRCAETALLVPGRLERRADHETGGVHAGHPSLGEPRARRRCRSSRRRSTRSACWWPASRRPSRRACRPASPASSNPPEAAARTGSQTRSRRQRCRLRARARFRPAPSRRDPTGPSSPTGPARCRARRPRSSGAAPRCRAARARPRSRRPRRSGGTDDRAGVAQPAEWVIRLVHSDDGGAAGDEPGRNRQQERPGARDDHPATDEYAMALEQCLNRADRHHAGQVPSRERQRAVIGAGREHQPICGDGDVDTAFGLLRSTADTCSRPRLRAPPRRGGWQVTHPTGVRQPSWRG